MLGVIVTCGRERLSKGRMWWRALIRANDGGQDSRVGGVRACSTCCSCALTKKADPREMFGQQTSKGLYVACTVEGIQWWDAGRSQGRSGSIRGQSKKAEAEVRMLRCTQGIVDIYHRDAQVTLLLSWSRGISDRACRNRWCLM
jgi:hypothetical protein